MKEVQKTVEVSKTLKEAISIRNIDGVMTRVVIPEHEELEDEGVTTPELVFNEDGSPYMVEVPDLDGNGGEQFDATGEDIIERQSVLDENGDPASTGWVKSSIIEGPILLSVVQELMARDEAKDIFIVSRIEALEAL